MMSDEHSLSVSDEDEELDELEVGHTKEISIEKEGYLSKWTNYIHGWQDRYVVLHNGTIAYFKSECDIDLGCRGSMSLGKAVIEAHEFDECRFDVRVNDSVYYLRTTEPEERQSWIDTLEAVKASDSGYGSETSLQKGASMLSLSSITSLNLSTASSSSFKKGRSLREKLMEMETFRDILCRQVDTLQTYFDTCADNALNSIDDHNGVHDDIFDDQGDHDADDEMDELSSTPTPASLIKKRSLSETSPIKHISQSKCAIDFKGEAITFKATTSGILATLSHCIDLLTKKEEYWKRRYEKESEKRKKLEEQCKKTLLIAKKKSFVSGPDFVEGPHMMLNEEEFFDAVETALDKHDEEEEDDLGMDIHSCEMQAGKLDSDESHCYSEEVRLKVQEGLQYIQEDVDGNWALVYEDGEMKVHRRDYEEGGVVCDPLKATHVVQGVTGREMAHYFYDKDVRMDWDTTVESFKVLKHLSSNTMIFHQVYKRVWPSSQRETLFMSHIKEIPSSEISLERLENEVGNPWLSINYSVEHPDIPINKYVRATCNVAFFCQTMILPREEGESLTRDHVSCRITYSCTVNPGGWAPPSVVRAVSKRECPKFLRKIGTFCQTAFKDKDIML